MPLASTVIKMQSKIHIDSLDSQTTQHHSNHLIGKHQNSTQEEKMPHVLEELSHF